MAADPVRAPGRAPDSVHALLDAAADGHLSEVERLAAIPAPSFGEGDRARHIAARFREAGLEDVTIDAAGNVRGFLGDRGRPRLILAAHMDTVYPRDAHRPPERAGRRLRGSSVRDNSAGVAAAITLASALRSAGAGSSLEIVSTTGEEGLGDLRGMRYRLRPEETRPAAVLVIDGRLGQIVHQGIAVRRFRVRCDTAGGHSWGDYGAPSAIHQLAALIHAMARIPLPADPKTTFNAGVIAGGTSVNAIAPRAEAQIDIRSVEPSRVDELAARLRQLAEGTERGGVRTTLEVIGDRPGGRIPTDHPLVAAVQEAHRAHRIEPHLAAASTDANIPLANGIPAVALGVSSGGQVHSPEEWLDMDSLLPGLHLLADAVAAVEDTVAGGGP